MTTPAARPVTLDEAKAHLRVLHGDEDGLIDRLIAVADEDVGGRWGMTGRTLITTDWEARFDAFPAAGGALELPFPPLQSVASVKYLDADGVEQTLDATVYEVDAASFPGCIRLADQQSWPATAGRSGQIRIAYTAGYGAGPADVPQPVRHALLLIVGEYYQNRDLAEDPAGRMQALPRLLSRFREPVI